MGGAGNDFLDGGEFEVEVRHPGNIASYRDDPNGITASMVYDGSNIANPFAGSTVIDGWGDTDTLTNITRLKGSAYDDNITIDITNSDNLRWYVWGMDGEDTIDGFDGNRVRVMYVDDPDNVSVDLGAGTATDGWGNTDTLIDIRAVSGSHASGDMLTGSIEDEGFFGTMGDDEIDGQGGWDWVDYNWIGGRDGFNGVTIDFTEDLAQGFDTEGNLLFTDELFNIEEAWASQFNDVLVGDDVANVLVGGSGFDTLTGNGGNDKFYFTWVNRFGPEWWDADYNTVTDFTATEGENDVLVFGETWGPGFYADGENTYIAADSVDQADPTEYQIIGVADTVVGDWGNIATVLNNSILAGSGDGTNDDTYFLAQDGVDTRILVWEGDVNGDTTVNDDELTWLAQLDDFTDIASLGDAHFQIV
jgi:hypothetical protein